MIVKYFAIIPLLTVLLCVGLGILTISRNIRGVANIGFMLSMISLAIAEAGNMTILLSIDSTQWTLAGMRISIIGLAFLPPTWLIFTSVFARTEYKANLTKWLPTIIGLFLTAIFFTFTSKYSDFYSISNPPSGSVWDTPSGDMPIFILGPIGHYFYIYIIIGCVLNLINLENTLRSSKGIQRWQIKQIIFGSGAILFLFVYLSSQALLFSTITLNMSAVSSVVILISVAMMTLFIVRHRLLDVDIFVSRHIVYNSITILVVGGYLFAVGLIVQGIKYFNIPFSYFLTTLVLFSSLLILVILLFSTAVRRKAQLFINRNFYKHKYEFRDKWMETTEKVSSRISINDMCETIISMIIETMGAKFVDFWLSEESSDSYRVINKNHKNQINRIRSSHPFISCIKREMKPFLLDNISTDLNENLDQTRVLLSSTDAVLCAPMVAGKELIGFLLQGEDISGKKYRDDDFELLKAITTQAAVQIKNIRMARELVGVKELEIFHGMSSFIMHDLKNLTNSLSLVSQNAECNMDNPEFQKDAIKTIDSTVSRMKGLISRLSNTASGFQFNKQEVDLGELVDQTLSKINFSKTRKIWLTKKIEPSSLICVDPHAMEMVLINLLTNAYESLKEDGNIGITVTSDKNIHILIEDNGEGMTRDFIETSLFQPFKTTKKGGFGIGLYQCKAIVEAHGGEIEVDSIYGEGTKVMITLHKAGGA